MAQLVTRLITTTDNIQYLVSIPDSTKTSISDLKVVNGTIVYGNSIPTQIYIFRFFFLI